ncbi:DNA cytosine methyltransferase [Burkholderia sp. Ac-20365]|uniref:DNA cytosine methyltransferase n=1 Tax=Burkholderia sp. Ac-20365 TaxID=2703897 RepID=UPI00197B64AD|nr:DNA cytosine methyltransferase [Burkholderia sp. Ac-20365]MBN3760918.1 DNA cytosine methyltransferase [Burkholderia sp. Ac-20365]
MNAQVNEARELHNVQSLGRGYIDRLNNLIRSALHAAVVSLQNYSIGGQVLRSRLNVENATKLQSSGLAAGARFTARYAPGIIEVVKDDAGNHVVSPKRFVKRDGTVEIGGRIDLRSLQVHENLGGEESVLALYLPGRVVFLHLPSVARNCDRIQRLLDAVQSGEIQTVALYAGVGTLDAALHEGFAEAGFESTTVLANDSWEDGVDCLLADNPASTQRTRSFAGGIEHFVASGIRVPGTTMICMGIPCKAASRLNVQSRDLPEMHAVAGHQVLNAVMAIQQLEFPPLVLVENVLAWADTVSFSMLRRVLHEQGYQTVLVGDSDEQGNYSGLNSNDYGDIEKRVRMALLAYPAGIDISFAGMRKSGPSTRTVGDIRLPEELVDPAEYEKGAHLASEHKTANGWRMRVVDDSDNSTSSISAGCWKQRVEDARFRHPENPLKSRLPLPEEHARLKGHDPKLVNSLVSNSHAHTALGNGTAKHCWVELARVLGEELRAKATDMSAYLRRIQQGVSVTLRPEEPDLFSALA